MVEFSDFYLGKNKADVKINLAEIKGGIKSEALSQDTFKLFKDILDKNSDGIVDKEEVDDFIEEIKSFAKDNNLSLKEAAKYLKSKDLKEIKQEELFKLIQNLTQASENIAESTVITDQNGDKTIFIKYKDETEETIYPDKSSKFSAIGQNNETIITNKNPDGEKTSEITLYSGNGKKTVTYENNEPIQDITEKDGVITTINYEAGSPKTKEVKQGEEIEKFTYVNGEERSVYTKKFVQKQWIETTTEYDENDRVKQIKSTKEHQDTNSHHRTTTQENFEYHQNNQISSYTYSKTEDKEDDGYKDISTSEKTITYDESGKRILLTSKSTTKYQNGDEDWQGFDSDFTIQFNKDGNIVGHVPNGETLQSVLKTLGLTSGSELYDRFMEMNKDQIKSFNNGKVKGFDVGAEIIIPGELEDKALNYHTTDASYEKERYISENIGKADVFGIPTSDIKLEKDSTWWEIAKQNLIDLGITNPTKVQIAENFDIIITLNDASWDINSIVEKGRYITLRAKDAEALPDKLKLENYNIKNLNKNYPSNKFKITKERINPEFNEWGGENSARFAIQIYDKSTGKQVLEVLQAEDNFSRDLTVKHFKPDGKVSSEIKFDPYSGRTEETVYALDKTISNTYEKGILTHSEYTEPKTGRTYRITNPNSPNKEVFINGDDYSEIQKYKNGKLNQRFINGKSEFYDTNGKFAYSIEEKNNELIINYPQVNTLAEKLKKADMAGALEIVKNIDITNYKAFLSAYGTSNNKDLIEAIKDSKLNDSQKSQLLGTLRKLINDDNKITKTQRTSQVSNSNYKGAAYDIKLSGDTLTIKNKTSGRISKIDLKKFLSKCTEFEQAVIKKQLVEVLPGEVLEDLAIESRGVIVSKDMKTEADNPDFEAAGYYQSFSDTITLGRKGVYNIQRGSALEFEYESSIPETYTHELGHAIDYNGYVINTHSSGATSFKKTFEKELKAYIEAGKVQYSYKKGFKVERETINTENDFYYEYNTAYATANEKEMFAECYTLMMLGDCQSKDHILKYFPETFNNAQVLLNEIRQKSDTERYNPVHV